MKSFSSPKIPRFSKRVKLANKSVIYGSKCSAEIKRLRGPGAMRP